MRYEDAKAIVDEKVGKIRAALKTASEAGDQEALIEAVKSARVQAGQLYTALGNDLKAAKAGVDPIEAREQAETLRAEKKAAREVRKAEREAAKAAAKAQAESEVAVG